jgi:hypothetical protein
LKAGFFYFIGYFYFLFTPPSKAATVLFGRLPESLVVAVGLAWLAVLALFS